MLLHPFVFVVALAMTTAPQELPPAPPPVPAPADMPVERERDEHPANETADEGTGETTDKATGETTDEATGETTDEATGETTDETTGETTDEATGETADALDEELHRAERALERAHRLFDDGEMLAALTAYETVVELFAGTVYAQIAQRMVDAMMWSGTGRTYSRDPSLASPITRYHAGPYSLRTGEAIHTNVWEKIDFGATIFSYSLAIGATWSVGVSSTQFWADTGTIAAPLITSATLYTAAGLIYLLLADPDRGDLPLTLGVSAYVPVSALLISAIARAHESTWGWVGAASGTLALPTAMLIGHFTAVDPGDAQLIVDSGFWLGLMSASLGTAISLATQGPWWATPDGHAVAAAGLGGLWVGLGLGAVWAAYTDMSRERVRVITWGGYAGTGLGGLVGAAILATSGDDIGMWASLPIGALAGLVTGYLASGDFDILPDDVELLTDDEIQLLTPTPLPSRDRNGSAVMGFGVNLIRGRW